MLDTASIYALNKKHPEAIIYTDANGQLICLTREDFDTEEDFLLWKNWSDADYHLSEKQDHVQANHTLPLGEITEAVGATDGPEVLMERREEQQERRAYSAETILRMRGYLTDAQFRRVWMYCAENMSEDRIAQIEGISQCSISESLGTALKKIRRILQVRQVSSNIRADFSAIGEGTFSVASLEA